MATPADQLANAAARGDLQLASEMLEQGADPNAPNSLGRTPIQVMMMGCTKMAELLIRYGANPSIQDPDTGTSPAHDAAREGFVDTLIVLYKAGASIIEPLDKYGKRPIDLVTEQMMEVLRQEQILD
ncbi:cyclin-dependent kinase 4 inhibitor B-like [Pelobates fuscus]|uniref:cyclin-dependent kinase 4 inhibitor B-like n=1 Tax=Pelobates fuscus TaxID=191477 RepID=UPI002FE48477